MAETSRASLLFLSTMTYLPSPKNERQYTRKVFLIAFLRLRPILGAFLSHYLNNRLPTTSSTSDAHCSCEDISQLRLMRSRNATERNPYCLPTHVWMLKCTMNLSQCFRLFFSLCRMRDALDHPCEEIESVGEKSDTSMCKHTC